MKFVTITEVSNGWVIQDCPENQKEQCPAENVRVFSNIKELQDKLPDILGVKEESKGGNWFYNPANGKHEPCATNPMYEAFQEGPKNL